MEDNLEIAHLRRKIKNLIFRGFSQNLSTALRCIFRSCSGKMVGGQYVIWPEEHNVNAQTIYFYRSADLIHEILY